MLFDVDPARLSAIAAVLRAMPAVRRVRRRSDGGAPAGARPPAVRTTTSLPEALRGTDLVFAAIRPGGTAGRVADERVAQDLGLLGQETTGAGGISYALRTIPEMLHLARQMQEHCPDAWLINFTNPAGMVTEALRSGPRPEGHRDLRFRGRAGAPGGARGRRFRCRTEGSTAWATTG